MRACAWLLVAVLGVGCETVNNYYAGDGGCGVADMGFSKFNADGAVFEGNFGRIAALPPLANNFEDLFFANNVGEEFVNIQASEPREIALTFGVMYLGNSPLVVTHDAALFAFIEWGAYGAKQAAAIDISNGLVLTLHAASLTVRAFQMMQGGGAFPPATPINSQVSIFAAPAVLMRQNRATLTLSQINGAMFDAVIPRLAERVRVSAVPNNSQLLFDLYTLAGALSPLLSYPCVNYPTPDLAIPNGAVHWQLTNPGLVVPTSLSVQFDLAL